MSRDGQSFEVGFSDRQTRAIRLVAWNPSIACLWWCAAGSCRLRGVAPTPTLPTNLSAHDTFKEMLKAQHETFAAELIYRLVKKGKAKPTKKTKTKKKRKKT